MKLYNTAIEHTEPMYTDYGHNAVKSGFTVCVVPCLINEKVLIQNYTKYQQII